MKSFSTLATTVFGLTLAMMLAFQSAQAEDRTWTQESSGRTIQGEFVKVEGDNVHISKAGGGIIPVPIAMLTKADQDFIAAQAKAAADSTTPTEEGDAEPMTVVLHDMHLCCGSCGRKVEESVAEMEGIKVDVDRKEGIVTMDAPSKKAAQDAIHAIAAAGFYGKSDSHDVDFKSKGASGDKVKTITVTGVHLCCKGCVTAADKAISSAEGVEGHTAASKADSFEITGDFSPSEVLSNLRKAGMNGTFAAAGDAAKAE